MKITKLTAQQEQELPAFREEWLKIGLRTDPIDRTEAESAVCGLYEAAGLKRPKVILFFTSPALCLLARAVMRKTQMESQLVDQLGPQLESQLASQLRLQLVDQLGSQLRSQLWSQLESQLESQLRSQLWSQLERSAALDATWTAGGQDAYWLAFYEFGRKIGVKYTNTGHLDAYIRYAKTCGWMYAYDGIALVSERPTEIHFDNRGLLHNENEMSVKFSDGWGVHSWHGIRVPGDWIENKKSITPQIALHHENVEQRRAACEILGWNNILRELNAATIDKSANPFVGELLEVDIPDIGKERFLRVMCGTGREFALPVPPDMQRASQAQAWLNFTTEDNYLPQLRT